MRGDVGADQGVWEGLYSREGKCERKENEGRRAIQDIFNLLNETRFLNSRKCDLARCWLVIRHGGF